MIIAQITDMHVTAPGRLAYGQVDTAGSLARCVEHLCRLDPRPDVAVMTGDLVDGGRPEEYALLRSLLAPLPMPIFVLPGNHDDRSVLRTALGGTHLPVEGYLNYVVDDYPVRIVALDTVIAGAEGGALDDGRLDWLDRRLGERPDVPTVIAMHHPPFASGIRYMDAIGLRDAAAFGRVVARHPQVERILSGHLHRAIVARVGNTLACTAPSTAHQLALDLREQPVGAFIMEPPAVYLHHWRAETGMVSHLSLVGDFGGARPFASTKG